MCEVVLIVYQHDCGQMTTARVLYRLTNLEITIDFPNLVRVLGSVRLCRFSRLAARAEAEDIRDNISSSRCCPSSFHPQGYLHMGLALSVWIIFRIFAQSLQNRSS